MRRYLEELVIREVMYRSMKMKARRWTFVSWWRILEFRGKSGEGVQLIASHQIRTEEMLLSGLGRFS